jgi:NAD/NADP transhydrogenase alpha subunit
MPADWMRRQAELVHQRATQADIVITTALIPGRAPVLLAEDTVKQMKPGSVVVDLAAAQGGNCPLTVADEVVERHGVVLIGHTNLAGMVAADASALYARNVLDFLKLIIDKDGRYTLNLEDDIVAACLMCKDGQVIGRPPDPDEAAATPVRAAIAPRRPRTLILSQPADATRRISKYSKATEEKSMEMVNHTVINLIIFVLAIYVGYHVVWTVTPALHTPLMAVTNAISAIIIVGAMLAAGLTEGGVGRIMGTVAVALAAVNVFGGFLVTQRMLEMFKKKEPKAKAG